MKRHNKRHEAGRAKGANPVVRVVASWFVFIALLALIAFGGRLGWELLAKSGALSVKKIEVTGCVRSLEPDVLAYAGVKLGDAMMALDLDDIAMSLRRHPWVAQATVKRRMPDKVTIEVVEHEPAMIAALGSDASSALRVDSVRGRSERGTKALEPYIANVYGELVKRLSSDDHLELPVVSGLTRELAARDPDKVHERVREARALVDFIQREGRPLGRIDEIRFDDALGWSVVTHSAMTVHLGWDTARATALAV
ncbi:MAG: FtsQ-type POTRA domain-containing protein, partial [Clostridia bacterium]|nr:FtsQ-type POTRA domain-containing protein [Deltaproteobacteria bacterium]